MRQEVENQAVRMRLPWAQGLERPPVDILLNPSLLLSENHPCVEEEEVLVCCEQVAMSQRWEVRGSLDNAGCQCQCQCLPICTSCPSVLASSIQGRQRDALTETAASIRGREEGQRAPRAMGRSRRTEDQVDMEVLEEGVCFPLVTYTDVYQSSPCLSVPVAEPRGSAGTTV